MKVVDAKAILRTVQIIHSHHDVIDRKEYNAHFNDPGWQDLVTESVCTVSDSCDDLPIAKVVQKLEGLK